jgi:hypothetical protein
MSMVVIITSYNIQNFHAEYIEYITTLVRKLDGKRQFRKLSHRREDNIKMNLKEIEWNGVWIMFCFISLPLDIASNIIIFDER